MLKQAWTGSLLDVIEFETQMTTPKSLSQTLQNLCKFSDTKEDWTNLLNTYRVFWKFLEHKNILHMTTKTKRH